MKILFLCGSAEPGKDGVGDYTRRLCSALIKNGHQAQMLTLCDKQAFSFIRETQGVEEILVNVKRIPIASSYKQRLVWTQEVIKEEGPDYISLQYVPYSFHAKGLPIWLPNFLKKIKGEHQWHIMFHELWIGISTISPLKHKVTGFFQRRIAQQIINKSKPTVITTSNNLYKLVLEKAKISSTILPLFSNIPKIDIEETIKEDLFSKLKINEGEVHKYFFTGVFGSIYPDANLEKVLNDLLIRVEDTHKKLVFISFGRIGITGIEEIERLSKHFIDKIQFLNYGELDPTGISTLIQILDNGISCTPRQHLGKSGVFAAMKLHGLSVLMSSTEIIPEYEVELEKEFPLFINRPPEMWGVEYIANNFMTFLNK
jgi:hypothetical protein